MFSSGDQFFQTISSISWETSIRGTHLGAPSGVPCASPRLGCRVEQGRGIQAKRSFVIISIESGRKIIHFA
jgi:hypothetical protein